MRWAMLGLACVFILTGGSADSTPMGRAGDSGADHDLALARSIALHEAATEEADLSSASLEVRSGTVPDSNVGEPCISGRLIDLKLIGSFPHIMTTGHPVEPGEHEDFTVTAVIITADAATGDICRKGVQTGDAEPKPGATDIPLN